MRIVVLRKIPDDPSLLRQWDDLVLQMERPEVFYTSEWALAVQSAYQASLKPLLFLGYDYDDLMGVACLAADPGERNVSFLAATTADYCDFLSHPQRRTEFVEKVLAELRRLEARNLVFASLPADSATPAALRTAAKNYGLHLYMRPACLCAQVELGFERTTPGDKDHSGRLRKSFRRYLRTMEREGPVTFAHLQSAGPDSGGPAGFHRMRTWRASGLRSASAFSPHPNAGSFSKNSPGDFLAVRS